MTDLVSHEDFASQELATKYQELLSNTDTSEAEAEVKPAKKPRKAKEKSDTSEAKKPVKPTSPIGEDEEALIYKNYRNMTNAKLAQLLVDSCIEKGIDAHYTEGQVIKFAGEKRKEFNALMANPTTTEEDKALLQTFVNLLQKEKAPSVKKKMTLSDIYALKQKYLD